MGVSKVVSSLNSLHCTRVGTPLYLAPELIKQIPYDFKIDIWSVGCSLYHLCALEPPFLGENSILLGNSIIKNEPKQINNIYTKELWLFISNLLNKKPDDRPNTNKCYEFIPDKIISSYKEKIRIINAKKQKEEKLKKLNTQSIEINDINDDFFNGENIFESINSNVGKIYTNRQNSNSNIKPNNSSKEINKKDRVKSAFRMKNKDSKYIDYFQNDTKEDNNNKVLSEENEENNFNINVKSNIKEVMSNKENSSNNYKKEGIQKEKNERGIRGEIKNNYNKNEQSNEKLSNENIDGTKTNINSNMNDKANDLMESNIFPELGSKENYTKLTKNDNDKPLMRPRTASELLSKFENKNKYTPEIKGNRILSGKTRPFTALKTNKLNKNTEGNNIINININLFNIDMNTLQMLNPKYLKSTHTSNILFVDNRHISKENLINKPIKKEKYFNNANINNCFNEKSIIKNDQECNKHNIRERNENFLILETHDIANENHNNNQTNINVKDNNKDIDKKIAEKNKTSKKYIQSKFKNHDLNGQDNINTDLNSKSKEKVRPFTSKPIVMKELPKPSVVLSKIDKKGNKNDENTINSTFRNNNNFNSIINTLIKKTLSRTSSKLTVNEFINIK